MTTPMKAEAINIHEILSPEEYQWYAQWLSDEQIRNSFADSLEKKLSPRETMNMLSVRRDWIRKGHPIDGPSWELPSEEETQKRIEQLEREAEEFEKKYNL